jgi:hypothetical protein
MVEANTKLLWGTKEWGDAFIASMEFWDGCRYHEAGHAVAAWMYRFPVDLVWVGEDHDPESLGRVEMDVRGQRFLHEYLPRTPLAWRRMQDLAVFAIAGIAAESRKTDTPFSEVRAPYIQGETNSRDYVIVRSMAQRLVWAGKEGFADEMQQAYISLWEQRAISLMGQDRIWRAVESVASALSDEDGLLDRRGLREALRGTLVPPRRLKTPASRAALKLESPDTRMS